MKNVVIIASISANITFPHSVLKDSVSIVIPPSLPGLSTGDYFYFNQSFSFGPTCQSSYTLPAIVVLSVRLAESIPAGVQQSSRYV